MNYWPAGPTNLIECYQPLFDLIEDISKTGQSTAKIHYGTVRFDFSSLFNKKIKQNFRNEKEVGYVIIIQIFGEEQHLLMMQYMEHGKQVEYGFVKVFGIIIYLQMIKKIFFVIIQFFVQLHNFF
jgi:hypothetical protein